MTRYLLMFALFVVAVAGPARWAPGGAATASTVHPDPDVPEEVEAAARQGRYWRASRILGQHLAAVSDTTPETILYASRMSAGWGDWETVGRLLDGRAWLDTLEAGAGWGLLGRSRLARGRYAAAGVALGRYLAVSDAQDPERGVAHLRRGIALGNAGDTPAALAAFDSAAALLPWFDDWTQLLAAEAAAAGGDTAALRVRLAASEPGLARDRGWRLRVDAARKAGDPLAARRAALDATTTLSSAGDRAAAWSVLGELRVEAGDSARAREAFRSAMEAAPGSVGAVDAARGMSGLSPSAAEWRTIARVYARHGNHARAADGFDRYLAAGAGTAAERARVRLELGEARFNAGRYAEAERGLLDLAEDDIAPAIAAEAMYLAGRARYRQGRTADGLATFAAMADRFPDQEATARGLYLLADLKHDDQAVADARRWYRRAADAAPALNEAGLALMRLAGLAWLDGEHAEAVKIWEEYRGQHPDGRRAAQATYWAARGYAELGRDSLAQRRFREVRRMDPVSYYGALSAAELGEAVLAVEMGPSPASDSAMDATIRAGLRRVDLLESLDRRDDLVHEVERLRRHVERTDGGDYALAEALNERGYTLTAISMGWDIRRRESAWNPRLLRIIYPFPFQDLVVPESRERGLDPYLVAGLIRRESAFNPTVSSSAGAIGLMQIMPETGRTLARAAGLRDYEPGLLRQPEVNVHLGVRYLEELQRRFGEHDLPLVLSAYNAGPNRAVRWREMPEIRDPLLFTERIPYNETRDYVRNVVLHRALYRELYPGLADED